MIKANKLELLKFMRTSPFKAGNTMISFARQNENSCREIEATKTKKLISEWKGLTWMNYIYGCVSVNEMQRISLIEMEFRDRKVDFGPLDAWYKQAEKEHDAKALAAELEVCDEL